MPFTGVCQWFFRKKGAKIQGFSGIICRKTGNLKGEKDTDGKTACRKEG
jgi:hypothetical protein